MNEAPECIGDRHCEHGKLSDYRYVIARGPIGCLNGYIQLPDGHPWLSAGEYCDDANVDVHGGITYGPDSGRWIGFDTAHLGDMIPGFQDGAEWTREMVLSEIRHLISQASSSESEHL